jgi:hypothetical protein
MTSQAVGSGRDHRLVTSCEVSEPERSRASPNLDELGLLHPVGMMLGGAGPWNLVALAPVTARTR